MRRVLLAAAACALALACLGCFDNPGSPSASPPPPPIVLNQYFCIGNAAGCQNQNVPTPTQPDVNSECSRVGTVVVKIRYEGQRTTMATGEKVTLDATAYSSASGGAAILVLCTVSWLPPEPSGCGELTGTLSGASPDAYNPDFRAVKAGNCQVSANVGNGRGSRTFQIQ
jgi:hypothetical protein